MRVYQSESLTQIIYIKNFTFHSLFRAIERGQSANVALVIKENFILIYLIINMRGAEPSYYSWRGSGLCRPALFAFFPVLHFPILTVYRKCKHVENAVNGSMIAAQTVAQLALYLCPVSPYPLVSYGIFSTGMVHSRAQPSTACSCSCSWRLLVLVWPCAKHDFHNSITLGPGPVQSL